MSRNVPGEVVRKFCNQNNIFRDSIKSVVRSTNGTCAHVDLLRNQRRLVARKVAFEPTGYAFQDSTPDFLSTGEKQISIGTTPWEIASATYAPPWLRQKQS